MSSSRMHLKSWPILPKNVSAVLYNVKPIKISLTRSPPCEADSFQPSPYLDKSRLRIWSQLSPCLFSSLNSSHFDIDPCSLHLPFAHVSKISKSQLVFANLKVINLFPSFSSLLQSILFQ